MRHLAEAEAERACYYETVGPLGVMQEGAATMYPLYHVLAAVGGLQGAELLECRVSDSLSCEAAAVRGSNGRVVLLLANYTNAAVTLQANLGESFGFVPSRLRVLDERVGSRQPGAAAGGASAAGSDGGRGRGARAGAAAVRFCCVGLMRRLRVGKSDSQLFCRSSLLSESRENRLSV